MFGNLTHVTSIGDNELIMTLQELKQYIDKLPNTERLPVIFIGHGNPMNAIEENTFVDAWRDMGKRLPRPRVILSISAHWLTEGTFVHVNEQPKTIHDFYGFPKKLYDISYPCPGAPAYAEATQELLASVPAKPDSDWGLDHGTWSVLCRMFPDANIPVFQMSIDVGRTHEAHYELGVLLRSLRTKGVLIMGSGNIVHNLGQVAWERDSRVLDWAITFDEKIKKSLLDTDHHTLLHPERLGKEAHLAIPTPDHYWPLLYALGAQEKNDEITFPVEGFAHSSISMRAVKFG